MLRKTRKKVAGEETGFTLVELLIVMIVSLIMLAGMIGLLSMTFDSFSNGKSIQSISDAARRALPVMDRQMKMLLRINDTECLPYQDDTVAGEWHGISFYADVDNTAVNADVDNPTNADKVKFYLDGTNLKQETTTPGANPTVTTATLCSYVDEVDFYYFTAGVAPGNDTPPSNPYTGTALNSTAGSIQVVIKLSKGKFTRTYSQNTFLRILSRG